MPKDTIPVVDAALASSSTGNAAAPKRNPLEACLDNALKRLKTFPIIGRDEGGYVELKADNPNLTGRQLAPMIDLIKSELQAVKTSK